ncbi:MAG: hypothetical protein JNL24_09225 [Bacteroidia bacterium]|nr:hypothetical protein [Bacteroidia bacterium]
MQRQFHLPEADTEYLDSLGFQWETIQSGGNWVLIHRYPLPAGYTVPEVSVALRIDPGYPSSQIDMAYFSPHVCRADGKPIGALAPQDIGGVQYQRWSRHRTPANPWRPELDNISTHLLLVNHWLEREFQLR